MFKEENVLISLFCSASNLYIPEIISKSFKLIVLSKLPSFPTSNSFKTRLSNFKIILPGSKKNPLILKSPEE